MDNQLTYNRQWQQKYDELSAAHADTRQQLVEANNNWHNACDVGRSLEVRNDQLLAELEEQHTLKPMQLCTPDERVVLNAMANVPENTLRGHIEHWSNMLSAACKAELDKRGEKS